MLKMMKKKKRESVYGSLVEVRANEKKYDVVEQLKKERKFYLGISEPGKVYSGKKKVRKMVQDKRNSR